MKDGAKRMKGSMDEIIIGKNHVNPALILHLAKSTKVSYIDSVTHTDQNLNSV